MAERQFDGATASRFQTSDTVTKLHLRTTHGRRILQEHIDDERQLDGALILLYNENAERAEAAIRHVTERSTEITGMAMQELRLLQLLGTANRVIARKMREGFKAVPLTESTQEALGRTRR